MIEFVGQDPESVDLKCPAVWRDKETRRIYFQGKTETDPEVLARLARDIPPAADESIVWLGENMIPTIGEAIGGTYDEGRSGTAP
ncbi:hypothetical protein [Actinomadura sp. NEAU-AAG7]|uniref:hypothetical protein n=1 Tax=Actinomadura sp. NEAU-AAG7 TaxID=2839640 RepID=UPI001BE4565D|nr:hypothetical protein [Actinomadura sp. NEAU-AAG7]MBT2211545.1 hypothetical protein [Actinomadura sp. NEAU-AAG7]